MDVNGPARLSVKFSVKDCVLSAHVTSMSEGLREGHRLGRYKTYYIYSINHPQIDGRTLYVRGETCSHDNLVATYIYHTPEEAKLARKAFQTIIRTINKAQGCTDSDK